MTIKLMTYDNIDILSNNLTTSFYYLSIIPPIKNPRGKVSVVLRRIPLIFVFVILRLS